MQDEEAPHYDFFCNFPHEAASFLWPALDYLLVPYLTTLVFVAGWSLGAPCLCRWSRPIVDWGEDWFFFEDAVALGRSKPVRSVRYLVWDVYHPIVVYAMGFRVFTGVPGFCPGSSSVPRLSNCSCILWRSRCASLTVEQGMSSVAGLGYIIHKISIPKFPCSCFESDFSKMKSNIKIHRLNGMFLRACKECLTMPQQARLSAKWYYLILTLILYNH